MISFTDGTHSDRVQFLAIRYCAGLDNPYVATSNLFTIPELGQLGEHLMSDLLWSLVEQTAPE